MFWCNARLGSGGLLSSKLEIGPSSSTHQIYLTRGGWRDMEIQICQKKLPCFVIISVVPSKAWFPDTLHGNWSKLEIGPCCPTHQAYLYQRDDETWRWSGVYRSCSKTTQNLQNHPKEEINIIWNHFLLTWETHLLCVSTMIPKVCKAALLLSQDNQFK